MADIFISYASLDRSTVRGLAEALETRGWSVWWDQQSLHPGQRFERIIEEAILFAKVVIVIWSQNSIQSDWVRDEAALALNEGKLVPLRIDKAVLPFRFRYIHTLDFSSWTGRSEAEPFPRLLDALSLYLDPLKKVEQPDRRAEPRSQAEPTDVAARPTFPATRKRVGKYLAAILVAAVVMLGVLILNKINQISLNNYYKDNNKISSVTPIGNVEYFTFVYDFAFDPGMRIWSRDSLGIWHERYADGSTRDRFSIISREAVNNCDGSVVRSMKHEEFEVFIPDQWCDPMQALFRWNKGYWKVLGEMGDAR